MLHNPPALSFTILLLQYATAQQQIPGTGPTSCSLVNAGSTGEGYICSPDYNTLVRLQSQLRAFPTFSLPSASLLSTSHKHKDPFLTLLRIGILLRIRALRPQDLHDARLLLGTSHRRAEHERRLWAVFVRRG